MDDLLSLRGRRLYPHPLPGVECGAGGLDAVLHHHVSFVTVGFLAPRRSLHVGHSQEHGSRAEQERLHHLPLAESNSLFRWRDHTSLYSNMFYYHIWTKGL